MINNKYQRKFIYNQIKSNLIIKGFRSLNEFNIKIILITIKK